MSHYGQDKHILNAKTPFHNRGTLCGILETELPRNARKVTIRKYLRYRDKRRTTQKDGMCVGCLESDFLTLLDLDDLEI